MKARVSLLYQMSVGRDSNGLFPNLGSVVEKAGGSPTDSGNDFEDVQPLEEIESLCMSCEQTVWNLTFIFEQVIRALTQGVTRMLLTSIPFFREVIVMSFRCEHCGNTNNEITSGGAIRRTQLIRCPLRLAEFPSFKPRARFTPLTSSHLKTSIGR